MERWGKNTSPVMPAAITFNICDFVINIYYFFHGRPTRESNFESIQEKLGLPCHRMLKHVTTRWLSIEPAAKRIIDQWVALCEYFIKFIPARVESSSRIAQSINISQKL